MTEATSEPVLRELVVCSLEPWDEIWRRNQLLVAELLELEPHLRVLFVGPAIDAVYELAAHHRLRRGHGLRTSVPGIAGGRLATYGPTKWVPRTVGSVADTLLAHDVERAARAVGFARPLLWVNNLALASLATRTGWPTLYDVTDDWLLASCTERERRRRLRDEATLMARAGEVVVCSPALERVKGAGRPVTLVTNAVDVDWIRAPTARPADMPPGLVACYVGTLHEDRLDVELCLEVASRLDGTGSLLLVGPDDLSAESRRRLAARANVVLLGARPHDAIPSYLQHADVLVVPHRTTPFTESLDPIKAYEYRAAGRPVVSTPVAGFRGLGDPVLVAQRAEFAAAVVGASAHAARPPELLACPDDLPDWHTQAGLMREVLRRLARA